MFLAAEHNRKLLKRLPRTRKQFVRLFANWVDRAGRRNQVSFPARGTIPSRLDSTNLSNRRDEDAVRKLARGGNANETLARMSNRHSARESAGRLKFEIHDRTWKR